MVFHEEDPDLSDERFRDFLLEELAYYRTREFSTTQRQLRNLKRWQELSAIAPITALMRSAMHSLHTALALKAAART